MTRGRGKPKYKGHSRHFTSADQLEAERKRDEERQRRREARDGDTSSEEDSENSGSSEDESEDESKERKAKGVENLIEVSNPNRNRRAQVKTEQVEGKKAQLTRRQKEEIARQNYQKAQQECRTEQAQADLARLAIIRKQREEAAAKASAAASASKK